MSIFRPFPSICPTCRDQFTEYESMPEPSTPARAAAPARRLRHHQPRRQPAADRVRRGLSCGAGRPIGQGRLSSAGKRPICRLPSVPKFPAASCCRVIPTWCRSTGSPGPADPFAVESSATAGSIGRGSADMKGFLAVCLAMVPEFLGSGSQAPIHLALLLRRGGGVHRRAAAGSTGSTLAHLPRPSRRHCRRTDL